MNTDLGVHCITATNKQIQRLALQTGPKAKLETRLLFPELKKSSWEQFPSDH